MAPPSNLPRRVICGTELYPALAISALLLLGALQYLKTTQKDKVIQRMDARIAEMAKHLDPSLHGQAPAPAPPPPRISGADTMNLYLGDGLVLCYVQPLGIHMVLEGADRGMTPHLCRGMGWEPDIAAVLRRLVQPGHYLVDVGTNVGFYTVMFGQMVGLNGRVLGLEANPRTYDIAKRNLEMLGMLSSNTQLLHRAAYSADNKVVQITTWKDRPLNNFLTSGEGGENLKAYAGSLDTKTVADIPTVTLDTALEPWQRLDFIKIDVEGAEAQVYAGLQKTLKRFPNVTIVMEVNTVRMGINAARTFYDSLERDFPQLRRIVGSSIVNTSVKELLESLQGDDLVVLSRKATV